MRILLQILIFTLIFIILFSLQRGLLAFENELFKEKDIINLFLAGAFSDLRLCASGFLPLLLVYFLSFFKFLAKFKFIKNITAGAGDYKVRIYVFLSSFYIALFSFLVILFCFVNYYYFSLYQNKIDIFIFKLKDDDTTTLLKIIWTDYPVLLLLFLALIFSAFCVFLNHKILNLKINFKPNLSVAVFLNLALILVYIISLRGPYKHISMRNYNYKFSSTKAINELSINPLIAFSWAFKQYKNDESLSVISDEEGQELENKLFTLYKTSPKNEMAKKLKPSVVINLMESFGSALDDYGVDLLGALKEHFEEDFVFKRFLSYGNFTMPSFSQLFFLSPKLNLSQSKYQNLRLKDTPIEIYKKAGYKVIFVYAGNEAWENIGNFLRTQGVDEIIDEITLMKEYKGAKESANGYGVADEYMYKKIYKLLKNSKESLFIISLSISNHPPYNKTPYSLLDESSVGKDLLDKIYSTKNQNALQILQARSYANNEFGKFLSLIKKDEKLRENTIIAMSGDHRQREFKANNSQRALNYAVPFYLYIPKALQKGLYYDKNRIGSHKDIFPTLYALSLSEVEFLSLGGKNMLEKPQDERLEFGFNSEVFIDKNGVYPRDSKTGLSYKDENSLLNTNESFELDARHESFFKDYERLNEYQLLKRVQESLK